MSHINKKYFLLFFISLFLLLCYLIFSSTKAHEVTTPRAKVAALKEGDTIGILAPAAKGDLSQYSRSIDLLKELGYQVKLASSVTKSNGYFAGTDEERAQDINDFFADDEVKAILCLRGGYGSMRILPFLDTKEIAKHPKLFIGFSDITALHAVLGETCHMVTIHGPMLSTFKDYNYTAYTLYLFENGLSGSFPIGELPMPKNESLKPVVSGKATGLLEGGNLTVIASLCGTPYELKGNGAILFLEDTNVDSYEVDRLMSQLYQNGLLSRVAGIVYGEFNRPPDEPIDEGDFTIDEVLSYYANLAGKPAIRNLPAGHDENNLFLPLGVQTTIQSKEDGTASMTLDESYLK